MRRFIAFFLGGLSAGIVLILVSIQFLPIAPILERLELQTIDYRMKFSPPPPVSDAVKIVLVDDVTNLSEKLATFTELVTTKANGQYKPKVIGFNYLFDVPEVNEQLTAVASVANNIYYGYYFLLSPDEQPSEPSTNQAILPFRLEITDIGDSAQHILKAYDVQLPSPQYLTTARGIGFVNTLADIDGVYRRVPLFLRYQENWYGSLALLIAMEYLDIESIDITFYPGQYVEIVKDDGSVMKIPVNQYGQVLIDFAYEPAAGGMAPFETLSLENDILARTDQMDQLADANPLAPLQDAVVLVGSGSEAAFELQPFPLDDSYPLIGIHVNMINNLLNDHFVRELNMDFTVGLVIILSMLSGFLIAGLRWWGKLLLVVLISGVYALMAYGVFFQFRLLLPIMSPLASMALTFCLVAAFVRYKPTQVKSLAQPQPSQDKRRKPKVSSEDVSSLESDLLEIREELDRKSFRLRSKIEELRLIQEQGESDHYDYSRQVASLQKEIRAREIEIKSLIMQEEEMRRQVENLPFTDLQVAQLRQNSDRLMQLFAKYGYITCNERLLATLQRIERLSKTAVTLLIQGEPGTGKNLLAKIIREFSPRHNRPILETICAGDMDLLEDDLFGHKKGAFPGAEENRNGYFREINGGTLILEEIGNLSLELQSKLMQTLRGKAVRPLGDDHGYPVDVRVIATTSQNLKDLVSEGQFRDDLYHHFSVFPLYLPPLRERKEDIPSLVAYFSEKYNRVHNKIVETVSDEAINVLIAHQWPGNIAELEKIVERAVAEVNPGVKELTETHLSFEEADLAEGLKDPGMLNYLISLMDPTKELPSYQQLREKVLVEIQRLYCSRLLRLHNGNIKNAAIDTGLKEETFKKMLTELMIDPENYRI